MSKSAFIWGFVSAGLLVVGCSAEVVPDGSDAPSAVDAAGSRDAGDAALVPMDAPSAPDSPMSLLDAPNDDTGTSDPDSPVMSLDSGPILVDAPVGIDAPVVMADAPVGMPDAPVVVADAPVVMADAPVGMPDAPAARQFCDVVYAVGGGTCAAPTRGARFHSIKTGLGAMNTNYDVGTNCATPRRGTGGGTAVASPFTPAAFPRGFVRLRFPASGGAPVAGPVDIIEYYLPIEFTVSASGTMVVTNVDHSAGMLRYSATGCGAGASGCVTGVSDTMAPTLDRRCAAVASGTVAGTSVAWGACAVATPAPCSGTGCTATMAQLNWTSAMSQDSMMGPGCLTNMNTWGGVHCASGAFCGFVPGTGAPVNATWDQRLPAMTFSSTAYGALGTTLTLTEMTIPDDPNDVYSGTHLVTATAVHTECGVLAALTCDDE